MTGDERAVERPVPLDEADLLCFAVSGRSRWRSGELRNRSRRVSIVVDVEVWKEIMRDMIRYSWRADVVCAHICSGYDEPKAAPVTKRGLCRLCFTQNAHLRQPHPMV